LAPGWMNISAIAAPPASIGRYISAAEPPTPVVSGSDGGSCSSISPRGSSGPAFCGGRLNRVVLMALPSLHAVGPGREGLWCSSCEG